MSEFDHTTKTMFDRIEHNFKYHPPKPGQADDFVEIRNRAKDFAHLINRLCPYSAEKERAIIALEEAVMWANAGIARN